ncbi:MAG TPA: SDR family oxidoreductase [Haliangiales bacterium]|nr:SDR family oxidoreductase [Haliangiales bacterium]
MELHGKVALVTGASAGIGLAVSRSLAAAGVKVAMLARTAATLERAAAEVPGAIAFPADATDFARMAKLPCEVAERFGGLDILVNNAGVNHRGPILTHPPEKLAEVVTANLTAPIYLTRVVADVIRPGGAIVMIASLAGFVPVLHQAAYSASKAGLRAFARAVAEELAERDVLVTTVSPGPIDTNFFGDVEKVPDLVFSQPMRTVENVAEAVMEALETRRREIALPSLSGKLATLGYVFPGLERLLRPALLRRGAKNKQKYIARRKAENR